MATTTQPSNLAAANGRLTTAPAVIRRGPLAEGVEGVRWQRQMPAWVISGGLHVVLIALFVAFSFGSGGAKSAPSDQIVETKVEPEEEKDKNLVNPDEGLDPDKDYTVPSERLEAVTVAAKDSPEDPVGADTPEQAPPTDVQPPAGAGGGTGVEMEAPDGKSKLGVGGGAGGTASATFAGRSGATKKKLLEYGGGNSATEAAVARGLAWLAKQQKGDGRWVPDGTSKDMIAGTGLGLLPFLAAGETHKKGLKYTKNVLNGLTYLMGQQKPTGDFKGSSGMYAHAIATVALCEAYGMTQDPKLQTHAQRAVDYIVRGQGANGSWGYSAGSTGDTSIVGWQLQALQSGKSARLSVPKETFTKAAKFLDSVQGEYGATYGYTTKGGNGPSSLSAVGLLCREYMGWGPKNQNLARGVDILKKRPPSENAYDLYYQYYATQVLHFFGGEDWKDFWNPKMQKLFLDKQVKGQGANFGSWPPDNGHIGSAGGRLMTTCLSLLTLEVYYRHLPLYRRDNAGLKELET